MTSFQKPEKRSTTKRRKKTKERDIKSVVRTAVEERDGYCRLYWYDADTRLSIVKIFGPCGGRSTWAHVNDKRRFATRGMEPEERHTTDGSIMLCEWHHQTGPAAYDAHGMEIEYMTERGCDGRLRFVRDDKVFEEPAR